MAARCPSTRRGLRDRAVVLLGFAGAFRRSELAALDCSDIAEEADGLRVTIRSSKTDREGRGVELAIPRGGVCPVGAVALWRQAAGIETGPLFRPIDRWGRLGGAALSAHAVGDIVKRLAEACGEDPEGFGGHSLRAGWITEAAGLGREPFAIARTRAPGDRDDAGICAPRARLRRPCRGGDAVGGGLRNGMTAVILAA